jgi:hypothetical protein
MNESWSGPVMVDDATITPRSLISTHAKEALDKKLRASDDRQMD